SLFGRDDSQITNVPQDVSLPFAGEFPSASQDRALRHRPHCHCPRFTPDMDVDLTGPTVHRAEHHGISEQLVPGAVHLHDRALDIKVCDGSSFAKDAARFTYHLQRVRRELMQSGGRIARWTRRCPPDPYLELCDRGTLANKRERFAEVGADTIVDTVFECRE